MYKLLIGEKEENYIGLIKKYVAKSVKEIEIIGVVSSGSELLELVERECPDIVLVSVEIQGISGLEVLRTLRQKGLTTEVVIMSEYNYFEFAKEAMHYGAAEFLMRPVKSDELIHTLKRIVEKLNSTRCLQQQLDEMQKRVDSYVEYIDFSFIYSFLFNGRNNAELKRYRKILGLGKYGFVLNIEVTKLGDRCKINFDENTRVYQRTIKQIISEKKTCVVGPKIGNRVVVYVDEESGGSDGADNIKIANMVLKGLAEKLDVHVRVGVGKTQKIELMHESYESALKSLCYCSYGGVVSIDDVETKIVPQLDYVELETKLLQSIKFGKEGTMELFCQLLDCIRDLNIDARKNKLIELLVLACHEVRKQGENEVNNLDYYSMFCDSKELEWEQFEEWVYKKIEYMIKTVRTSRSARKSDVVKVALAYINEHYQGELALDAVSDYVGVTPQHLSKVFKEETGFKYVDFLTTLRIEKAKEYLLEGNKTIKEICFLVGFNDPNYFSRLFKKIVGKSPTEYVKCDRIALAVTAE